MPKSSLVDSRGKRNQHRKRTTPHLRPFFQRQILLSPDVHVVQCDNGAKNVEYLSVLRPNRRVQRNSRAIVHDTGDDCYYGFARLIRITPFLCRLKFKIHRQRYVHGGSAHPLPRPHFVQYMRTRRTRFRTPGITYSLESKTPEEANPL